jgi:hypothetical protein
MKFFINFLHARYPILFGLNTLHSNLLFKTLPLKQKVSRACKTKANVLFSVVSPVDWYRHKKKAFLQNNILLISLRMSL